MDGVTESAHKTGGHLDPNDLAGSQGPSTTVNLKDKKTFYLETSAFLTGVNIVEKGPKKIDEGLPKSAEINQTHAKLNELVTDLGTKISEVIKDHENDFFVAFKNKMYAIMKEMRELKEKASSERHKAKQEARLINLEKERDWFRREALKLDKMCKDHKRILNKLKATLENIEEDRDFFQEQLFNAKKVNKALLMELEKYKTSLMNGDNMAITGGPSVFNSMKLQYQQPLAIQEDYHNKKSANGQSTQKLKSQINEAIRQKPEEALQDPVGDLVDNYFKLRDSGVGEANTMNLGMDDELDERYLQELDQMAENIKPSDYRFTKTQQQQNQLGNTINTSKGQTLKSDQLRAIENGNGQAVNGMVSIEEYRKIVQENAELKDREIKYAETIRHLKNQIDSEKKNARSLRAEKVNFMMQRNELEEFFLQCIEEVRKDIVKRKSITTAGYSTTKKNLKRSTSTASMTKTGTQAYQEEQNIQNAKLDQYTATDKRKVIELLMSNENVLLFLYEKLFPATNMSSQSTAQSRQNTAGMNSMGGNVRFTTDSGVPIGLNNNIASASTMQGRSQTSVGGSRLNVNRANMNSLQNYGFGSGAMGVGSGIDSAILNSNSLPQASIPGMSIQNNIQNLNLNINLSKGAYGSSQFLPQQYGTVLNNRGATAPLGQARTKKGIQAQLNALGNKNKYAL
eukprot:403367516